NLLSNAIKFTPKGKKVKISIARVDKLARISVEDEGAGMDPSLLPHVFDRFFQADTSITRKHGGLGLGLAIVRNLVELHQGTVRAESAGKNKGAKLTVEIPALTSEDDTGDLLRRSREVPMPPTLRP